MCMNYIYIYIYVYTCVYMCIHIHTSVYTYHMCVYIYIYIYIYVGDVPDRARGHVSAARAEGPRAVEHKYTEHINK